MTDMQTVVDEFSKYAALIRSAMGSPREFEPRAESATALQVERGIVWPQVLLERDRVEFASIERMIELGSSDRLPAMAVVDAQSHHRPVYRPLLVYSCLQTFRMVYETLPRAQFGRWEEGLRPWCDLLESELAEVEWPAGAMPAALGGSAAESAWTALALHVAGKVYVRDAWTDLASHAFGKLIHSQQPIGTFLESGHGDNLETGGYHELVLLHAAASYAVQTESRALAAAVARNTEYHLQQTQPDHSTSQPWGLFAFIWNPPTRSLADQLLHSARASHADGPDGVSLMLLADALYCLELFKS